MGVTICFFVWFQTVNIDLLPPGTEYTVGNFEVNVPERTFLATERDAPLLFGLLGLNDIPNCYAIYVDNSNERQFFFIVQRLRGNEFFLDPDPGEHPELRELFSQMDILSGKRLSQACTFYIEPTINREEGSFVFGLSVPGDETKDQHMHLNSSTGKTVVRKIWIAGDEVLIGTGVMPYQANENYHELMNTILESISSRPKDKWSSNEADAVPKSYLTLFNIKSATQPQAKEADPKKAMTRSWKKLNVALLLCMLIIFTLVLIRLKKAKP